MSDIVKRLKEWEDIENGDSFEETELEKDLKDAAEEIERLEDALSGIKQQMMEVINHGYWRADEYIYDDDSIERLFKLIDIACENIHAGSQDNEPE